MKSLGIEEEYEGIGHCVLGYAVGNEPKAAKIKREWLLFEKILLKRGKENAV